MPSKANKILAGFLICLPYLSWGLSSDTQKPYITQADTAYYQSLEHRVIYIGHVHITQGSTSLTGSQVIILSDKKTHQVIELTAYGHLARYSTRLNDKHQTLWALARIIKYWPRQHLALLMQKAKVTQDKNVLMGEEIWYDVQKQMSYIPASQKGQHTTLIIAPQKSKKRSWQP